MMHLTSQGAPSESVAHAGAFTGVLRVSPPASFYRVGRLVVIMGALLLACVGVGMFALSIGATRVDLSAVLSLWFGGSERHDPTMDTARIILWEVRLPRVFLGFVVGGGLAVVGVVLQSLLRNPLADPYVLGVSSGAALGVAVAMWLGIGTSLWALPALPCFGLLGSLAVLFLLHHLARSSGRLPLESLLLAGVILNAILTALIMFVSSVMEPTRSAGLMAWMMGSLATTNGGLLAVVGLSVGLGVFVLLRHALVLNVLSFGEATARSLGADAEQAKRRLLGVAAVLTGAVVAMSGMIGFVGMIVPHAVRLVLGPDHRLLLPAATLVGGMFLVLADTVARTVMAPGELPVGVVTALAGGPCFLYLLLARRERVV